MDRGHFSRDTEARSHERDLRSIVPTSSALYTSWGVSISSQRLVCTVEDNVSVYAVYALSRLAYTGLAQSIDLVA